MKPAWLSRKARKAPAAQVTALPTAGGRPSSHAGLGGSSRDPRPDAWTALLLTKWPGFGNGLSFSTNSGHKARNLR